MKERSIPPKGPGYSGELVDLGEPKYLIPMPPESARGATRQTPPAKNRSELRTAAGSTPPFGRESSELTDLGEPKYLIPMPPGGSVLSNRSPRTTEPEARPPTAAKPEPPAEAPRD